ncbi:VTT domain-containing protein [Arthrobacter sp. zg-Y453]|uniref:VTT domain-containing protein n=1 Tax=Arthrobacter caoxuetaonis TaxID=2886935 RepID=A0A9X1MAS3_9MICC|nr:VTT domain-containing protein [Arthrobacter caoxuetaonis]USQ56751.1 VTT domain-containing protein [Arthrobacter caoxuetaonis]
MAYPVKVILATAAPGALQPVMSSLLPDWLDPQVFLSEPAIGPWVVLLVCGIVFVETGLLIGFFLPGDSLLFTAGLLVATGAIQINVWLLILLVALSAFAGDQLGYYIGRKAGPVVFNRPESRFFSRDNVTRAEKFFAKHGGKAVVLARFVPVVRTFTPVVAGVGRMHYPTFIAYNAIGAAVWAVSVTLLGYLLGDRVPFVRDNLDLIVLGVIALTLAFVVAGLFRPGRRPRGKETRPRPRPQSPEAGGLD